MKVYVVTSAELLYDDSICARVLGVFDTKDKAIERVRKQHEELIEKLSANHEIYDDDYTDGDDYFRIYLDGQPIMVDTDSKEVE